MPFTTIIGIDGATVAPKVGIARARRETGRWRLIDVARGSASDPPAARIASWLDDDPATLLALDAPLGWPAPSGDRRTDILAVVGRTLVGHEPHRLADATWDELDAALCVVAGIDFLAGRAAPPEDPGLAKREGWIWVRRPGDGSRWN